MYLWSYEQKWSEPIYQVYQPVYFGILLGNAGVAYWPYFWGHSVLKTDPNRFSILIFDIIKSHWLLISVKFWTTLGSFFYDEWSLIDKRPRSIVWTRESTQQELLADCFVWWVLLYMLKPTIFLLLKLNISRCLYVHLTRKYSQLPLWHLQEFNVWSFLNLQNVKLLIK